MDFARRQLLKYGWEEGKGLGKNESGIAEALKPKLKFDTTGVGHDSSEQFTFNWWENMYNQAADNIDVVKSDDGNVNMKLNTSESLDITTKKYSYKNLKKKNNLEYGCFLKTSKLTPSGIADHEDKAAVTTDMVENVKVGNLTDEELFAACGGRTAHKGARHGLKLNGKLARIEEQEMQLLKQMKMAANNMEIEENNAPKKYSLSDSEAYEPKLHKKKKSKKKKDETAAESNDETKVTEAKNYKKRKHSQTEYDEIYLRAVQKTETEYYIAKQERRRRMKKLKKIERKKISKITNMLENVCVSSQQENKDDGFEEKSKTADEDESSKKKHKKKKRKLNSEVARNNEEDDGFEEYISEVNEKLMYYKELRKDLQEEKRKGDDKRISKMAEDFERKL